jgi:hypothetical protein
MIIDCATCVGRHTECGDCVISVVLGSHEGTVDLDADEQTAVAVLAGSGLVPPLRLMPPGTPAPHSPAQGSPERETRVTERGTATRWSRRPRAG